MADDEFIRIERVVNPDQLSPGDALEEFFYTYLDHELSHNRLPFVRKCCKLFRKKKYWSDARNGYVETDISIEVYEDRKCDNRSLLWVWECKDWTRPVTVGEIEKFQSTLQQIGKNATKGTVVICSGLTEAAFNFAKTNNIGFFKLEMSEDYQEARVKKVLYAPGSAIMEDPLVALFNAGQECAFIPPDIVLVSHDPGAGVEDYLERTFAELIGREIIRDALSDGMKGTVIGYGIE